MKRIRLLLSLLLTAAVLLPLLPVNAAEVNPFASQDAYRQALIELSGTGELPDARILSEIAEKNGDVGATDKTERLIVRFRDDASLAEIHDAVSAYEYELLANSSERIFVIGTDEPEAFTEKYGRLIEYSESEGTRELTGLDDTYYSEQWQYDFYDFDEIWSVSSGSTDVVVAVIDSGVNRNHADLKDAAILAGYDAVNDTAAVTGDTVGHGTGVIGVIAATANNGIGIAGVCRDVTILPVLITRPDGEIRSADFIRALYFAADAGADVINMSFGGTDRLTSEQEAVSYAASRGCILVGAAGNYELGGEGGDEYFYPASYDHVTSVASFGATGALSHFSRYNDRVDIAAPGEDVRILDGTSGSAVIADNGTSFAAPFVSAVAALALAVKEPGVTVGSDEFESLVSVTALSGYSAECGNIDPAAVIAGINDPIVTGIRDGGVYFSNVTVRFNLGTATLDSAPFVSGTTVKTNGTHTLFLTYRGQTREYSFITDNLPLTFECPEGESFSSPISITFKRGTATLNGVPYLSGSRISRSGHYNFVLTGPYGNTVEKSFTLYTDLPLLFGIENGGVYEHAVELYLIGDGSATVGTKSIHSGESMIISTPGVYTVTLRNVGASQVQTLTFTITGYETASMVTGLEDAEVTVNDHDGTVLLRSGALNGLRVYDARNGGKLLRFIETDGRPVLGWSTAGDRMVLLHGDTLSVMDLTKMRTGTPLRGTVILDGYVFTATATDGNSFYALAAGDDGSTELVKLELATFRARSVAELGPGCDTLVWFEEAGRFVALDSKSGGTLYAYSPADGTLITAEGFPAGELAAAGGSLCVGTVLYDEALRRIAVTEECCEPIGAVGNMLFSHEAVIDPATGRPEGLLWREVLSVSVGTDYACMLDVSGVLTVLATSGEDIAQCLRCAEPSAALIGNSSSTSPFSVHAAAAPGSELIDWVHDKSSGSLFAIFEDCRYLYEIKDDLSAATATWLNEQPAAITVAGGELVVTFEDSPLMFVRSGTSGRYVRLSQSISATRIAGDGTTLFFIEGDSLYSVKMSGGAVTCLLTPGPLHTLNYDAGSRSITVIFTGQSGCFIESYNAVSMACTASERANAAYGPMFRDDTYIYAGNTYYEAQTLKMAGATDSTIRSMAGGYLLTDAGIVDISERHYAVRFSTDYHSVLLSEEYEVYSYSKESGFVKLINPYSAEPSDVPDIVLDGSVQPDGSYKGEVRVSYSYGVGYMDGHSFESGGSVSDGGTHTLTVVLPYGNIISRVFTIDPVVTGIVISGPLTVPVNGAVRLTVRFLPDGVEPQPVIFSSESDIVRVDSSGNVQGLSPGTAVITARTADGLFSDTYTVTVSDFVLSFSNSRFRLTSDGMCVVNIAPGTTVGGFIPYVNRGNGTATVCDRNGHAVSASTPLKTGMRLVIENAGGTVADVYLAVRGDVDGDGQITPVDLTLAANHVFSGSKLEGFEFYAADATLDNKLNLSDLLMLRAHLAGKELLGGTAVDVTPSGGSSRLAVNSAATPGGTVTVSIIVDEIGARALSGSIKVDDSLEILSVICTVDGWAMETSFSGGVLGFAMNDEGFDDPLNAGAEVMVITLRVGADVNIGENLELSLVRLLSDGGESAVSGGGITVADGLGLSKLSALTVVGAALDFDPDTLVYRVTVPFDMTSLVIFPVCDNEWADITISDTALLPDTTTLVTITVDAGGSNVTQYRIYAKRESAPQIVDKDPRILRMDIEGGTLAGEFSPDVYDYIVFADGGITITAVTVDPDASYTVVHRGRLYTVLCTASDGKQAAYTFTILRTETSDNEQSHTVSLPRSSDMLITAALVLGAVGCAVAAAVIIRKRKKNIETLRNDEKENE